jgi:hypothetical protein
MLRLVLLQSLRIARRSIGPHARPNEIWTADLRDLRGGPLRRPRPGAARNLVMSDGSPTVPLVVPHDDRIASALLNLRTGDSANIIGQGGTTVQKRFFLRAPIRPLLPPFGISSQLASILCCILLTPMIAHSAGLSSRIPKEGSEASNAQQESDSNQRKSMALLRRLASEQVNSDHRFLGKTRFTIDQQDHTFSYDLSAVPTNLVLSDRDPYAKPLEALIRVESLRRDLGSTIPNETFWSKSLDSVELAVQRCVQVLENTQPAEDAVNDPQACSNSVDVEFKQLETEISSYADAHGLKFTSPSGKRDPVLGYRVHILIDPPKARVRVMPLLAFKKYQYSQTPKDKYQWSDLLASDNDMIGWYHYRAEWPAELNGPDEGDIEVKMPATITFTPNPR